MRKELQCRTRRMYCKMVSGVIEPGEAWCQYLHEAAAFTGWMSTLLSEQERVCLALSLLDILSTS